MQAPCVRDKSQPGLPSRNPHPWAPAKARSRHPLGKEGHYVLCTTARHWAKRLPEAFGMVPIFQMSKLSPRE